MQRPVRPTLRSAAVSIPPGVVVWPAPPTMRTTSPSSGHRIVLVITKDNCNKQPVVTEDNCNRQPVINKDIFFFLNSHHRGQL